MTPEGQCKRERTKIGSCLVIDSVICCHHLTLFYQKTQGNAGFSDRFPLFLVVNSIRGTSPTTIMKGAWGLGCEPKAIHWLSLLKGLWSSSRHRAHSGTTFSFFIWTTISCISILTTTTTTSFPSSTSVAKVPSQSRCNLM